MGCSLVPSPSQNWDEGLGNWAGYARISGMQHAQIMIGVSLSEPLLVVTGLQQMLFLYVQINHSASARLGTRLILLASYPLVGWERVSVDVLGTYQQRTRGRL